MKLAYKEVNKDIFISTHYNLSFKLCVEATKSELTTIYKCSICHENKLEVANYYILKRCKYTKLLMKQKLLKHCIVDLKISDKTEQTTLSNISDSIICHMSELFL